MSLWSCPNGHGAVRGPTRPRRDNICRYCLPCSERAGKLVARTCEAIEKRRADRRAVLKRKPKPRSKEPPSTAFICGLMFHQACAYGTGVLLIEVRGSRLPRRSVVDGRSIVVYDHAGATREDARAIATLAILRNSFRHRPIEGIWLVRFREAIHTALGVRPRLDNLDHAEREVAELLRAKEAAKELR